MKKEKQLIERNLKFSEKYIYLDIIRGSIESGQVCACENCGKVITNMVKVVNMETKKQYYIGTDCAETLSQAKCLYNNGSATDYQVDLYAFNKTLRYVTELRKGKSPESMNEMYCTVKTDSGKFIDCSVNDLRKFFPEMIATFK